MKEILHMDFVESMDSVERGHHCARGAGGWLSFLLQTLPFCLPRFDLELP